MISLEACQHTKGYPNLSRVFTHLGMLRSHLQYRDIASNEMDGKVGQGERIAQRGGLRLGLAPVFLGIWPLFHNLTTGNAFNAALSSTRGNTFIT